MMAEDPSADIMHSQMKVLQSLMGGSFHSLPDIQRDYSWKLENAEALLESITSFMDSEQDWLFLGPIVELKDGDENMIIDGQQRYSTLTILYCAMRDYLIRRKEQRNRKFVLGQVLFWEYISHHKEKIRIYTVKSLSCLMCLL